MGRVLQRQGVSVKPGLWTGLDWTMDWTMDWTGLDWTDQNSSLAGQTFAARGRDGGARKRKKNVWSL